MKIMKSAVVVSDCRKRTFFSISKRGIFSMLMTMMEERAYGCHIEWAKNIKGSGLLGERVVSVGFGKVQ